MKHDQGECQYVRVVCRREVRHPISWMGKFTYLHPGRGLDGKHCTVAQKLQVLYRSAELPEARPFLRGNVEERYPEGDCQN